MGDSLLFKFGSRRDSIKFLHSYETPSHTVFSWSRSSDWELSGSSKFQSQDNIF